jgi:GNAT superfamily N-acetyltransferase
LRIREFKENDRQALQEIYLKGRIETFLWVDTSAYTLHDFDTETAGEYILVAEKEDKVTGFIAVWKMESFIHHLYVDSDHQKKGTGKALLNAVVNILDQPVRLKCVINNKKAVSFYKSQGWKFEMIGTDDIMGKYYLLKNQ